VNEAGHSEQTALTAQRFYGWSAFGVAPAVVAGAMAGGHMKSVGKGAIVFLAVLVATLLLENNRRPLHLMPLASLLVRAMAPVVGIGVALALFAAADSSEPAVDMLVPLAGAWLATLISAGLNRQFQQSRQVRIALIGSPGLALGLDYELRAAGIRGYKVIGWLGDDQNAGQADGGPRRLGALTDVREIVGRQSIELLVHSNGAATAIAQPQISRLELFEWVAANCLDLPVRLIEATQLYEDLLGHVPLGQSNSAWFQYLMHPRYRAGSPISKRVFDIVVGTLMLVALSPVLLVLAIAIKLHDRGPILYRQLRVGERGKEFEMIKMRSMEVTSENEGARWSSADDQRVTPVGKLMRRFHLDEMPQLWNVLRGEMTIVGPRPERRELIIDLEQRLAYYDRRHLVKPGLAGWAQARCGYGGTEEGTSWKLCHDLYYLKHRSLYFDLLVLIENVRVSFGGTVQFGLDAPQEQFILGQIGRLP
jgi:exopolysaccharide biosynthesis polyprenyl glycosylphosphotransferase